MYCKTVNTNFSRARIFSGMGFITFNNRHLHKNVKYRLGTKRETLILVLLSQLCGSIDGLTGSVQRPGIELVTSRVPARPIHESRVGRKAVLMTMR